MTGQASDVLVPLTVGRRTVLIAPIDSLRVGVDVGRLPYTLRILLENVVRAAALCDLMIRPQDLPERVRAYREHTAGENPSSMMEPEAGLTGEAWVPLAEVEGRYVARVLAHTGGNKQAAARLLGVDRKTLQRMIVRHDLAVKSDI